MKISELMGQDKAIFEDIAYIKDFSLSETRGGKKYGQGTLIATDKKSYGYKVWNLTLVDTLNEVMEQAKKQDVPFFAVIQGETNVYNDSFGVFISTLSNLPEDAKISILDFLESDYTIENLMPRLVDIYKNQLSEDGLALVGQILTGSLAESFVNTTSALYHHDAQIHGLLAHTTKMMEVAGVVIKNYPHMFKSQTDIDLFLIGLLLHDIGKTEEYTLMSPSSRAFLGHRYLGALILENHRTEIEKIYGKVGCDHLVSILLQHHGIYDERPRTALAYAVHLVDVFEAQMTTLNENIGSAIEKGSTNTKVRASNNETFRLEIL